MSDIPSVSTGLSVQRALIPDSELGYAGSQASSSAGHPGTTLRAPPDHEWTDCMRSLRRFSELMGLVAVSSIIITGLIAWIVVLHTQLSFAQRLLTKCVQSGPAEAGKDGEVPPPCDEDWIWHRNVCYYVSVEEGNWTEAQDFCTVLNSSLAMIDTQKELDFLLRHKGDPDLWIGLRRMGPGQLWIWVDGFKFDNWFTVEDFAECAYLNYGIVKSSECYSKRQWICSKISMYEKE